jgi:hypothetical protein
MSEPDKAQRAEFGPYGIPWLLVHLGREDEVLGLWERAPLNVRARSERKFHPVWNEMRDHPRFQASLKSLPLADSLGK